MRPIVFLLALTLTASQNAAGPEDPLSDLKMPDGTSRKEALLKADHRKSLEEAQELSRLSVELQADLEREDRHILSLATLKKLDRMEKLVKNIRSRMKRY